MEKWVRVSMAQSGWIMRSKSDIDSESDAGFGIGLINETEVRPEVIRSRTNVCYYVSEVGWREKRR